MTARLTHTPVLETERLVLRAPQAADFKVFAPFVTSDRGRHIGGGGDKDIGHAWRVLALLTGHWHLRGWGTFVAEEKATGRPIGSMGPWYPEGWPERELGWTIWTEAAEGRGFAHEAAIETRRHAFETLGWSTAVSYIAPDNARSIALARRLGCARDPDAAAPAEGDLVYRHPAPEKARGRRAFDGR